MFETLDMAPADPILGLSEAFANDANPDKINLSVGVYKDAHGATPVLDSVKKAEARMLETEATKAYMPITGSPGFGAIVQRMMFGPEHDIVTSSRAVTAHCPGGTGALRVTGNFLKERFPGATVWLSDPTWANHANIFAGAGVPTKTYPYFDRANNSLALDAMLQALSQVAAGDVVLLHGCCHNPTGQDPTAEQWGEIAKVLSACGAVPLVDFAYQGFGDGIDEDATGLRQLCEALPELIVCSSFSKNFGLYRERVGAITLVCSDADVMARTASHLKASIRCNYSNPPAHGAGVVATILEDDALTEQWRGELAAMRERINGMRKLFADTLDQRGVTLPSGDNSFITRQRGMFSFSGLSKEQVQALRESHSVYIVGSGRINVAGMTEDNMPRLCDAIAAVL